MTIGVYNQSRFLSDSSLRVVKPGVSLNFKDILKNVGNNIFWSPLASILNFLSK